MKFISAITLATVCAYSSLGYAGPTTGNWGGGNNSYDDSYSEDSYETEPQDSYYEEEQPRQQRRPVQQQRSRNNNSYRNSHSEDSYENEPQGSYYQEEQPRQQQQRRPTQQRPTQRQAQQRSGEGSGGLARCARPLGTAALVEADGNAIGLLRSVGLQSPLPMLRLMMAKSGCFRVVDRGVALGAMRREQALNDSGMLRDNSQTARGNMVVAQYLITPNVIFSNPNSGGVNAGGLLGAVGGSLFGAPGAAIGHMAGNIRIQEAQTALFLTDASSGEQTGVAEGTATATDFNASGFAGLFGGGVLGGVNLGGYQNTAEGKLIVAAFADAFNKLVNDIRAQQMTNF